MHSDLPFGGFEGFDEAKYHADPGFGSGSIKALVESPARFVASRYFPQEATDAMDFGSAFHLRLLEPELAEHVVRVKPEGMTFSTKEGKAWRDGLLEHARARGGEVLFISEAQDAVLSHMLAGVARVEEQLGMNPFEPGVGASEVSYFWDDDGARGKARIDRELYEIPWLLDVKTTSKEVTDRELIGYAARYGWAIQAAWYRRGVARVRGCIPEDLLFAFVVFQTVPPFSVRVCPVPPETMLYGDRLVERALEAHREVLATEAGQLARDPISTMLELRFPEWALSALKLN